MCVAQYQDFYNRCQRGSLSAVETENVPEDVSGEDGVVALTYNCGKPGV